MCTSLLSVVLFNNMSCPELTYGLPEQNSLGGTAARAAPGRRDRRQLRGSWRAADRAHHQRPAVHQAPRHGGHVGQAGLARAPDQAAQRAQRAEGHIGPHEPALARLRLVQRVQRV